jgi:hypothetical protein
LGALIKSFSGTSLDEGIRLVDGAYEELRAAVKKHWPKEPFLEDASSWARQLKALLIPLRQKDLICKDSERLIEIISQCATVERLLDVLRWARQNVEFRSTEIVVCNPTTGSGCTSDKLEIPTELKKLDLVLKIADKYAFFEVSDNIGAARAKKEATEIESLLKARRLEAYKCSDCYRVMSKEAATYAKRSGRAQAAFTYRAVPTPGQETVVLRVEWLESDCNLQTPVLTKECCCVVGDGVAQVPARVF